MDTIRVAASLNVDRKLIIEIGSNESKTFVIICTWSRFVNFTILLATRSFYFDDLSTRQ